MKTSEKQNSISHLKIADQPDHLSDWSAEELGEAWKKGLEGEPISYSIG